MISWRTSEAFITCTYIQYYVCLLHDFTYYFKQLQPASYNIARNEKKQKKINMHLKKIKRFSDVLYCNMFAHLIVCIKLHTRYIIITCAYNYRIIIYIYIGCIICTRYIQTYIGMFRVIITTCDDSTTRSL